MSNFLKRLFGRRESAPPNVQPVVPPSTNILVEEVPYMGYASIQSLDQPKEEKTEAETAQGDPTSGYTKEQVRIVGITFPAANWQNCRDWKKAGFQFALSPEGYPFGTVSEFIKAELQPFQNSFDQATHDLERRKTVREDNVHLLSLEITKIQAKVDDTLDLQLHLESDLRNQRVDEAILIGELKARRDDLAAARRDTVLKLVQMEDAELRAANAAVKQANLEQQAINDDSFAHQQDKIQQRRSEIKAELGEVKQRWQGIQAQLLSGGIIAGLHVREKLAIGSLLAGLVGWAMAILAGKTCFDDDTILEFFVLGFFKQAARWQDHWYHQLFFILLWMGGYFAIAIGLAYFGKWIKGLTKGSRKKGASGSGESSTEGKQLTATELPLEYNSFEWAKQFKSDLVYGLAPAWALLGLLLIFIPFGDAVDANTAENSYSGFLIGFSLSWVSGLLGYYLFYRNGSAGLAQPSNQRALSWVAGVLGLSILTFLCARFLLNADLIVSFAAAVLSLFVCVAIGVKGRILQSFLLSNEERQLSERLNVLSINLSRLQSPWATFMEVTSTERSRSATAVFQENLDNLQQERLRQATMRSLPLNPQSLPAFISTSLQEYIPSDQYLHPHIVAGIEATKRSLAQVQQTILRLETHLALLLAGNLDWQKSLRSRLGNYRAQIAELLEMNHLDQSSWVEMELQFRKTYNDIAQCIREGYENGQWYIINQPLSEELWKNPRTTNQSL